MAGNEATLAPLHDAAARSRSREQGAHVRRQGRRSSRRRAIGEHQGQFRQHDVAETGMPGAMVFGYFLPKQKVARSRSERNRFWGGARKEDRDVDAKNPRIRCPDP